MRKLATIFTSFFAGICLFIIPILGILKSLSQMAFFIFSNLILQTAIKKAKKNFLAF
ncbi:hypothetical protein G8B26_01075 [Limosilactobacillus reuteri]|nr:hypothetical protein G8B26_01075 [Limosilactobacillus reuteri]